VRIAKLPTLNDSEQLAAKKSFHSDEKDQIFSQLCLTSVFRLAGSVDLILENERPDKRESDLQIAFVQVCKTEATIEAFSKVETTRKSPNGTKFSERTQTSTHHPRQC